MNDCILYAKVGNESEVGFMDIAGLDAALSTVSAYDIGSSTSPVTLQEDIGVAMLGKSLDMTQTLGAGMVQMMENSVTPYLGSNIDLYI